MAKIKIRQFKGLLDYSDLADSSLEYASKFNNAYIYPGYIESKSIKFEPTDINLPNNESLVKLAYVFLDEDKYKNKYTDNNKLKLIRDYKQNYEKYKFYITEKVVEQQSEYYIYLNEEKLDFVHTGQSEQLPQIENINGIVKIFFLEQSYYLSQYSRHIFNYIPQLIPDKYLSGIKVKRLIQNIYNENNVFPFTIEQLSNDTTSIVNARLEVVGRAIYYWQGDQFVVLSCKLIDEQTNAVIRYPSNNGYMNLILTKSITYNYGGGDDQGEVITEYFFAINKREKDLIVNLENRNFTDLEGTTNYFYRNLELTETFQIPGEKFWGILTDQNFSTNNIPLTGWQINMARAQSYYNEYKFPATTTSEFLVTINNTQGEFVHSVKPFDTFPEPFLFKISAFNQDLLPEDTVQVNLYMSRTTVLLDKNLIDKKEYELVQSFSLVEGLKSNFPIYIDQLTPKGIMLSQRIGNLFSPSTYKLIDGFSQYKTINGISFAINGDRIYFPAVGNGKVLNNVFYDFNFIPAIEGQILTEISKKLAVIDTNKDITQIIDFQPVENTLLFIPVVNYDIRVKNYQDIVQTQEGTILNVQEGVLVITGDTRAFISNTIKNVINKNFDKSKIFYNRNLRELYYTFEDVLYVYRFETQSWNSCNILQRGNGKIIEAIEDYVGNFYFLIQEERKRNKIYKLSYYQALANIGYKSLDLEEPLLKKTIKYITFDYEGEVNFNGKKIMNDKRTIETIPVPITERKFKDYLEFDFTFKGKIYSLELELDITPHIKF